MVVLIYTYIYMYTFCVCVCARVLANVFRHIRDDGRVTSFERLYTEWGAFLENGNLLNENELPFNIEVTAAGGQDSVIGIATFYWLNGSRFEPRWGQENLSTPLCSVYIYIYIFYICIYIKFHSLTRSFIK
jgi:hypothetical protein